MPYVPAPEVEANDEVADVTSWSQPQAHDTDPGDDGRKRFTASLRQHAERAAARLGTTPDILIAQAALETGWGKHVMIGIDGQSSHNLFSIKADPSWSGDIVKRRTLEYMQGRPVSINAGFRSYEGIGQAFDDYADFISQNPRYQRALQKGRDPRAYVQELQRAGYATDPRYAQKILEIHQQVAAASSDNRG
jgi:flagellar protein FlgJ